MYACIMISIRSHGELNCEFMTIIVQLCVYTCNWKLLAVDQCIKMATFKATVLTIILVTSCVRGEATPPRPEPLESFSAEVCSPLG